MQTKLHINAREGIIEVEGEPQFVRDVYANFKDTVLKHFGAATPRQSSAGAHSEEDPHTQSNATVGERKRTRSSSRRGNKPAVDKNGAAVKGKSQKYKPVFLSNLDLHGLKDFTNSYEPENNYERVLLYCKFLENKFNKTTLTADEIYSCFFTLRSEAKVPRAYPQVLHDTKNKRGYIEVPSLTDISVTAAGENHFNFELQKKKSAAE